MGLRETLEKYPVISRIIVGVVALAAVGFGIRPFLRSNPDSLERRSQMVTIRDTETGDEWEMNRGEFERLLLTQEGMIDPTRGIPSKFSEGRLTGVLVDKSDWTETVERINTLKEHYAGGRSAAP